MTTYEIWATVFGVLTTIIAGFGLCGLWRYVKYTKTIAEATRLQGDVLSRPTITVRCKARKTSHQPFSEINTETRNHSMTHANIKVTIKVKLRVNGADHDEEFLAPTPYDGTVWSFPARQGFGGHFAFDELKQRTVTHKDTLTLVGTIESSAFGGQDKFERDPPILYRWKHSTQEWVPGP